ncbi:MAG: hypothetical protein WC606_04445 [Candidatus Absconditabacterales bacterium]
MNKKNGKDVNKINGKDVNKINKTPDSNDGKVISIDELKKKFAADLLNPLAEKTDTKQFASVTYDVLKDEFARIANMKIKETPNGFFKICITKKDVQEKSTPQIEITITKDFKFNIHLNDYKNYEDFYFYGEKLTTLELMDEVKNFNAFLLRQSMSENSKLEITGYDTDLSKKEMREKYLRS